MAHPAPFRNKLILLVLFSTLLGSCDYSPGNNVHINMNDIRFRQRGGILSFESIPFSGFTYELFENGDTAKISGYKNGKQNGLTLWWYPNRQLAQQRFFVDGWKQGIHKGWWPNGKLQFEYRFVNDEYEGEIREWYSTGRLFRIFHYAAGHEAGSEKMWWEDGKMRANYAIVNGEKFGLFGQKLCANTLKQ